MIAPSILSAISQGFNASQIIKWLISNDKNLSQVIKNALSQGYDDDKILSYLTNGQYMSHGQKNEALSGTTQQERASKIFNAPTNFAPLKKAAAIGAAGIGVGSALGRMAGGIGGLGRGAGNPLPSPPLPANPMPSPQPPIGPQPMGNAPVHTAPIPPVGPTATPNMPPAPSLPTQQPNIPLPTQTPQTAAQISPEQSIQTLEEMGLGSRLKALTSAGNSSEGISTVLDRILTPGQRKWLDEKIKAGEAKPMQEMVSDFIAANPAKSEAPPLQSLQEALPLEPVKEEPITPQKGNLVFDESSGVSGQLKDIKNKEALVEEDGKLHKVKSEDLLHSELPEKDLASLYDDLIKGIEKSTEKQVSRSVEFAGYDPEHNELVYRPYLGGVYVYEDISPEDAELLTSFLTKRKTSGESLIGAWEKGTESPIGAAMSALIRKLQQERGGKGNEYS